MNKEQFIQTCKRRGLNVTYQRMAIFDILQRREDHPTAEVIYREVLKNHPTISLATVYNTLETLASNDLITKVTHLHDVARYDKDVTPHHHLVCIRCKRIMDIPEHQIEKIDMQKIVIKNFKILDYSIHFHGFCSLCQKENEP